MSLCPVAVWDHLCSEIYFLLPPERNKHGFLKLDRLDISKPGGLDLSRSCLNQDFQSQYSQNVSLDS
jgi:hypothetical protein